MTLSLPLVTLSRILLASASMRTRKRMSCIVSPDCLRNFWKSASLGKDCFLVCWNCFWTSASETLTPWSLASFWIQSAEIRNCMTWSRRPLYCCWHWAFSCASVGAFWPLGGLGCVLRICAMQFLKSGGSLGMTSGAPGWL